MKPSAFRAALTALALAGLLLAGAGVAVAADPTPAPTIGGALSVTRQAVQVVNRGNVPALVTLTTDGTATFTPTSLLLDPGQAGTAQVGGTPAGMVSATFTLATAQGGGEVAGVTLQAPFRDPLPWDPRPWAVGLAGLLATLLGAYGALRWARANLNVGIRVERRVRR